MPWFAKLRTILDFGRRRISRRHAEQVGIDAAAGGAASAYGTPQ
jgi:hypothetical protein